MENLNLSLVAPAKEPQLFRQAPRSQIAHSWLRFGSERARLTVESILLGLVVVLAAVWFSVPYFARDYINRGLSNLPDYTGRVESVRIHPWTASLDVYEAHLDKRTGEIPVHFFYSPRCHISLQWSEISHGAARASLSIFDPQINLVTGPSPDQSQLSISNVWLNAIRQMIPWRINQIEIHHGDIHYLDFHANPQVDLEMNNFELAAENMSNSKGLKIPLPATVTITARPLQTGTFVMNLALNLDEQFATFTQSIRMEHVPAVGANAALQKYLKVRIKSGEIGIYSELAGDKGIYHGYVKPFFYKLEFEPKPTDEGTPGAVWSGILNAAKGLFENDNHVIAGQSDISGRLDQPNVDPMSTLAGVLCNACIEALRPGFDPNHAPSKSADTVVTPLSPSTKNEATLSSPSAKN